MMAFATHGRTLDIANGTLTANAHILTPKKHGEEIARAKAKERRKAKEKAKVKTKRVERARAVETARTLTRSASHGQRQRSALTHNAKRSTTAHADSGSPINRTAARRDGIAPTLIMRNQDKNW